jgi:hypothetical protein
MSAFVHSACVTLTISVHARVIDTQPTITEITGRAVTIYNNEGAEGREEGREHLPIQ